MGTRADRGLERVVPATEENIRWIPDVRPRRRPDRRTGSRRGLHLDPELAPPARLALRRLRPSLTEERTDLRLGELVEALAAFAEELVEPLVPLGESPRRPPQRALGVDAQLARERHRREQHVADLLFGVGRVGVAAELGDLLVERLQRRIDGAPLEAPTARATLNLRRAGQGGKRLGDGLLEGDLALLLRL